MKKINLFFAAALTLVMASCDNFELPNPPAQSNEDPEAVFTDNDIAMAATDEAINLITANEEGKTIEVATVTSLENFPEGYSLAIDMQVGNDNNFGKTVTLPTEIVDNSVYVEPGLLNGAIQQVITKAPGTINVPVRFLAFAERDNTRARLGGLDRYFADKILSVRTFDPEEVIENAYYIVPFDGADPLFHQAIRMNNNSGEGINGYDAPEFSYKINVAPGQEYTFKIAPESAMAGNGDAAGLMGANMNGNSGKLGTNFDVIVSPLEGSVLVTINMEQRSVSFSYAFEVLYPFGANAAVPTMLLYTNNYINYGGVTRLNKLFTLGSEPVKGEGITFRNNSEVPTETNEENPTFSGGLTTDEELGENIVLPWSGNNLYYVEANLPALTYFVKPINSLSIIGQNDNSEANWNLEWAAANNSLTPSSNKQVWTGTDIEIGTEFKINANGAWDVDFGADANHAEGNLAGNTEYFIGYKGKNINATPGKYDVTISFASYPYTITLTKKN